jgi:uncharacterized protein
MLERHNDSTRVLGPTVRTAVRRKADRACYDWPAIEAILDEGLIAHVGFVGEQSVCVLPMAYARIDDAVYLHGAAGNAMLRRLSDGTDVCVTVTLLDALVLSRSAFHHSMNYRSVVVVGTAIAVDEPEERLAITEASAKVRAGGPIEDPDDLGLPHWAGEIPIRTDFGNPIPDQHVAPGLIAPTFVRSSPS